METCPPRARAALESVPGVAVTSVSQSNDLAVVRLDPERVEDTRPLEAALAAAGFRGGWDITTEKRSPQGSAQ